MSDNIVQDLGINVLNVKNVKWFDAQKTQVAADVEFSHMPGEFIPFAAGKEYDYQHGIDFYDAAIAGEFGDIGDYVAPAEPTAGEKRSNAAPLSAIEIRQKLKYNGVSRSDIYAMFDAMTDKDLKDELMDLWEYSDLFYRTNEHLIAFGKELGLTDEDLDSIWGI